MISEQAHRQAVTGHPSGRLFIVSAPSGAGKTTLCAALRRHFDDLAYSVSYTTRHPRECEQHGKDYYFISAELFEAGIAEGRWAEWAKVHGNLYGTSARWITETLSAGRDILMDIDVQGARQILKRFPEAVTIFIQPPSLEVLEQRLRRRGSDSDAAIAMRLDNARAEMAHQDIYRHVIINDDLRRAERELIELITAYRQPK